MTKGAAEVETLRQQTCTQSRILFQRTKRCSSWSHSIRRRASRAAASSGRMLPNYYGRRRLTRSCTACKSAVTRFAYRQVISSVLCPTGDLNHPRSKAERLLLGLHLLCVTIGAMNWNQMKKNVHARVQLRPTAHCLDEHGRKL